MLGTRDNSSDVREKLDGHLLVGDGTKPQAFSREEKTPSSSVQSALWDVLLAPRGDILPDEAKPPVGGAT